MSFQDLFLVSMCLAGVVLYRICLDSWTPRTPITRLKRCSVIQNQGFANLGKVWKWSPRHPFWHHFGDLWASKSDFLVFYWVSVFYSIFSWIRDVTRTPGRVTGGSPTLLFQKISFSCLEVQSKNSKRLWPRGPPDIWRCLFCTCKGNALRRRRW